MFIVPLSAIPNQTITIKLDGDNYDITIKDVNNLVDDPENNLMAITIIRNNVEIISGFRLISGYTVIPYLYLENGNFAFQTDNDEYPNYLNFGITQFLLYKSALEMEAFRAAA